jgi:hypothetical protein
VDAASFARLKTLAAIVPPARPAFDALIAYATAKGYQPYIVSAVRTCAEQASNPSTKVKRSWHLLGRAVDVELHARGTAATIEDAYAELGAWWEAQGGTWGGRWTELYPLPHPDGWCAPTVPGDACHFQFTDGVEAVPDSVWSKAVTQCPDVDALVSRYFASQGVPQGPTGVTPSPAPNAPPGSILTPRGPFWPGAVAGLALVVLFARRRA